MTRQELFYQIRTKQSYLCVGLDTDISKLPERFRNAPGGLFEFNKAIIDATAESCVAYKINTAFYEALGVKGWEAMERTVNYIPPTHFRIADAKRGDIGNTSSQYARAFFETMPFDAVTVAPYMGEDSVRPFLEYPGKWAIVLGLTSNKGAEDFEKQRLYSDGNITRGTHLYEMVLETVSGWGNTDNLMFVVGATQAADFANIRKICPDHFFLVPGVGAQGGSLRDISEKALLPDAGLLVNASRAVLFASTGDDFAQAAGAAARGYQQEMAAYLDY